MAVAFDALTSAYTDSTGTTMTISNLTVGAGANRALTVHLQCGSQSVTFPLGLTLVWDPTGANQALTQIPGTLGATTNITGVSAIYGLIAPVSGNKNLVITWLGTGDEMHACAASWTGVDQTSVAVAFPNGTTHVVSGAASPCTVTITSAAGNMVTASHSQNANFWNTISDNPIGGASGDTSGPNLAVAANYKAGAATATLTASFTGTGGQISVGCDILAAGGGGGGSPFFQTDWPNPSILGYHNSNRWQETGNTQLPIPLTPQGQPFSLDISQFNWPNVRSTGWYRSWEQGGNSLTTITTQVVSEFNWQLPYRSIPTVQTWTYNQTILMGPTQPPFKNYDWPNPLRITWYQTWQEAGNVQLPFPTPFRPFDWPLPKTLTWDRFWSQSPSQPAPQTPFFQSDWPLPRTYQPIQQFWSEAGNVQLPFPTPFFQVIDSPLPVVRSPIDQTWLQNLLESTLLVQNPFRQIDWPIPVGPKQPILIWTNGLPPGAISIQGTPFYQLDWPVPKGYPPIDQFWFVDTSNLPIPPPPPPPVTSAGRQITEAEVRAEVAQWWKRVEAASKPKLLTFSDMGKMGGRPRKHS